MKIGPPRFSESEERLAMHIKITGLPLPEREFRFDPNRRWRLDFAWPHAMVCCEVDGGTWNRGRHLRPKGYERDCEKLNALVLLGWRCVRFTSDMVSCGVAIRTLEKLLR